MQKKFSTSKFFDHHTSVSKISQSDSKSSFRVLISPDFSVGDVPNGGYLMSLVISASRQTLLNFMDPLSVSVHFFNKVTANIDAEIETQILQVSRSTATIEVSLLQKGQLKLKALGTFGTFGTIQGIDHSTVKAPNLIPVEECVNASEILRETMGNDLNIVKRYDLMLPPQDHYLKALQSCREDGREALMEGWVRFSDLQVPTLKSLSFFCDGIPPPVLCVSPFAWVPTMEYTVHFWERPMQTSPWLRVRFVTPFVRSGILHTDGEIWSADGERLLAKSRQLARVLTPRPTAATF